MGARFSPAAPASSGQAPRWWTSIRSLRALVITTIVTAILGAIGFFQPIDDYAYMLRTTARKLPPSQQIVMIGIDDKSLAQLGAWPLPRRIHAELVDKLKAAGAKRIFFDVTFTAPSTPTDDRAFRKSLCSAGNVYLPTVSGTDVDTGGTFAKETLRAFRDCTRSVGIPFRYNYLATIRRIPYESEVGDRIVQSMSAVLSSVPPRDGSFSIDYSIDISAIPTISLVDALNRPGALTKIAGRDIIIYPASSLIGDFYFVPGRGLVHGGMIHAYAAETLKRGAPTELGWIMPFLTMFVLTVLHQAARARWARLSMIAMGSTAIIALPLALEALRLQLLVAPAAVLFWIVTGIDGWRRFKLSAKGRGNVNAVSGMPTLAAFRETKIMNGSIVAARVHNFAEITAALPAALERVLVDQIAARLALGAQGATIHQGDGGFFVWTQRSEGAGDDQLDALHALFRSPALVDGRQIDLAITFGVDRAGDQRDLPNRIGAAMTAADEAASEGARWKAFDPARLADADWRLSLLGRLDAAIDEGEIWVAYQPQLDLKTNRICGAEALVRWSHPEKGEISPIEFVLAAEQHDRIDKLTDFVLADAIRAAAAINRDGTRFEVAVNLSARVLERPGLANGVRALCESAGLPLELLTLEVTESAAMSSAREAIRTLEEIGSLGINVSIDDYGTGFSTLEYFKRIPATEVKIDRSFVAAIDTNPSDKLMVRSTIDLAHSLDRHVVAEGVETTAILDVLREYGCDKVQGYLIGRPMKLAQLIRSLGVTPAERAA